MGNSIIVGIWDKAILALPQNRSKALISFKFILKLGAILKIDYSMLLRACTTIVSDADNFTVRSVDCNLCRSSIDIPNT